MNWKIKTQPQNHHCESNCKLAQLNAWGTFMSPPCKYDRIWLFTSHIHIRICIQIDIRRIIFIHISYSMKGYPMKSYFFANTNKYEYKNILFQINPYKYMFGCNLCRACWLLFLTGLPNESGNMVATFLLHLIGYERIAHIPTHSTSELFWTIQIPN